MNILEQSFIFLDRITSASERKIWEQGVLDWNAFRESEKISGIGAKRKSFYELKLYEIERALKERDLSSLMYAIPRREHWRLYELFKDETVYLDIETAERYGDITVLGVWDGSTYYSFVKGCNMEKEMIKELFSRYKLFVTFNGSSFDLPIIERFFNGVLPEHYLHVDVRHLCSRIGLDGGLKKIEHVLNISRGDEIDGMSGAEAGLLWHEYLLTGDTEHVELLLEYNEADCRNLEPLAKYAVKELWKELRKC